jgi:general L-amino acid transport system substrate-binding protein
MDAKMKLLLLSLVLLPIGFAPFAAKADATLDAIHEARALTCGVVIDEDDYSEADTHGNLSAFEADFCRALSAEILGEDAKVMLYSAPDEPTGLAALRDRKIDVLFGATPNPVIAGVYGVGFGPPIFYDGQGFLVSKTSGIASLTDLSKRHVCFINASPPEHVLYDVLEPMLKEREIRFPFSERGEMEVALVNGLCDAMTGDISWMASARAAFHGRKANFTILPETLTVDPLAPTYRAADPQFASLVAWTVWTLIAAEEHGVTQANVEDLRKSSDDAVIKRLTGAMPWIGKAFGVSDDAFFHALHAVGNYGEIYDRTVGDKSALLLPRGRNALASKGGLLWSLPIEPLE